jgi:hypothetical protein
VLTQVRASIELKASGFLGESTLQARIYDPILDALADYQIKTIAELEQTISVHNITLAQLIQAVIILTGMGALAFAQDDAVIEKATARAQKLNAHLCQKARYNGDIVHLASPVTGGGINVGRFAQLFLLARWQGLQQSSEWAQLAWQTLQAQKQLIIKEGVTLQSEAENTAELLTQAQTFEEKTLPILQALGIA